MGNPGVPSTGITAGLGGFIVLFALAIVCWFLFRSMNGHLRNVRYQAEQEEKAEQERAGQSPTADDE